MIDNHHAMSRAQHHLVCTRYRAACRAQTNSGQDKAQDQRKMAQVSHDETITEAGHEGNLHAKAPP